MEKGKELELFDVEGYGGSGSKKKKDKPKNKERNKNNSGGFGSGDPIEDNVNSVLDAASDVGCPPVTAAITVTNVATQALGTNPGEVASKATKGLNKKSEEAKKSREKAKQEASNFFFGYKNSRP